MREIDSPFRDHVLSLLYGIGEITCQPLFGGHGIYWRDVIFGIVFGGKLYLKVDDQSKPDFMIRGMGPFRPNERQTLKSYYYPGKKVGRTILSDSPGLSDRIVRPTGGSSLPG